MFLYLILYLLGLVVFCLSVFTLSYYELWSFSVRRKCRHLPRPQMQFIVGLGLELIKYPADGECVEHAVISLGWNWLPSHFYSLYYVRRNSQLYWKSMEGSRKLFLPRNYGCTGGDVGQSGRHRGKLTIEMSDGVHNSSISVSFKVHSRSYSATLNTYAREKSTDYYCDLG